MERIDEHEFFLGLFCGLRLWATQTRFGYSDRQFSHCSHAAYQALKQAAGAEGLEVGFFIKPHPIHGDSMTAIAGIQMHQSIAPFEAPRYDAFNLIVDQTSARRFIAELPGSEELWRQLTEAFLHAYDPGRYEPVPQPEAIYTGPIVH